MFYQDSVGRTTLRRWLADILPALRPDNADARLLDEITAAEILDLAYIQGAPFDSAMAAHCLYPLYVEQAERFPAPSEMSVAFPVDVGDEGRPELTVALRCARPSELKIGQGGIVRVRNPRRPVP